MSIRVFLGILLAAPITALTLFLYTLPCWMLGWLRFSGWHGPTERSVLGYAPCWTLREERIPVWLAKCWKGWAGHCVGTTVIVRLEPGSSSVADRTLRHELHHVDQIHRLGILQPILYVLSSLALRSAGEGSYKFNAFEIAARRAAGQVVDGESYVAGYAAGAKRD